MSHKRLIILAFEKAKRVEEKRGNKEPSKAAMATEISIAIREISKISFGEKSLMNYYKKALENGKVKISQIDVINALLKYVEFNNYPDFVSSLQAQNEEKNIEFTDMDLNQKSSFNSTSWILKNKTSLVLTGLGILLLILVTIISVKEKQRWMIWKADHYEEVDFSTDLFKTGKLKLYKPERIEEFKKLETDCNLKFFRNDGSVNIWYGKNSDDQIELFTSPGLHPTTGKTLKPITQYMIDKYICS